jgi:hypothetical protein
VPRAELQVDARVHVQLPPRHAGVEDERDGVERFVEHDGVDERVVVRRGRVQREEEGGAARGERAAQAPAEVAHLVRGARRGEGVARVQALVVEVKVELPVQRLRPRAGENLNLAEAEAVVLGREGVLVDAYFAYRRARGERLAGVEEAVYQDLPAARPDGRAGQRLQRRGQLLGVFRQRVEGAFVEAERAPVLARLDAEGRLGPDRHLLPFEPDGEPHVQLAAPARDYSDALGLEGLEAARLDAQRVRARREAAEGVAPLGVGGRAPLAAGRVPQDERRADDDRARRVCDAAGDGAAGLRGAGGVRAQKQRGGQGGGGGR